jgi:hypothetical protein
VYADATNHTCILHTAQQHTDAETDNVPPKLATHMQPCRSGSVISSKKGLGYLLPDRILTCTYPELQIPFSHFGPTTSSPSSQIQRTPALIDMGLLTMYLHLLHPNDFGGA